MNFNKKEYLIIDKEDINSVKFEEIDIIDKSSLELIIEELNRLLKQKSERDKFLVNILDSAGKESIEYTNEKSGKKLNEEFDIKYNIKDEEEVLKVQLEIFKTKEDYISIYSLENFKNTIFSGDSTSYDFLLFFESIFKESKTKYELILDKGIIETSAFLFADSENINFVEKSDNVDREFNYKLMQQNCNYIGEEKTSLLPNDFHRIKTSENLSMFNNIFDSLKCVYSILFLSNITKINKCELYYRMDGYKTIQKYFNVGEIINKESEDNLFNIYQWVYKDDKNITERIGMARNIISLHIKEDNLLSIGNEVLPSIKSGYEIYLKENVENYISILNQVVILLNKLEDESMKIADRFTSRFKGNFATFLTFFISTILLTTISEGNIVNIFTRDIALISYGFLLISIGYLIVSLIEFNKDIKRLEKSYERNKKQYGIILDTNDIKRIFNEDSSDEERSEIKSMKITRLLIFILWIATIIILGIVIFILSSRTEIIQNSVVIVKTEMYRVFIKI